MPWLANPASRWEEAGGGGGLGGRRRELGQPAFHTHTLGRRWRRTELAREHGVSCSQRPLSLQNGGGVNEG